MNSSFRDMGISVGRFGLHYAKRARRDAIVRFEDVATSREYYGCQDDNK
jgi:hypothetical protein